MQAKPPQGVQVLQHAAAYKHGNTGVCGQWSRLHLPGAPMCTHEHSLESRS